MHNLIKIENIEGMRRREGIYDVALWDEIQALKAGEWVRLTFLSDKSPAAGEMVLVRITSIKGDVFRGKLATRPSLADLSELRSGSLITFSREHIHSVVKEPPASH